MAGQTKRPRWCFTLERLRNAISSNGMKSSPYFGRIDFAEEGYPLEERYIGYEGEELDGRIIVDWRSALCTAFQSK